MAWVVPLIWWPQGRSRKPKCWRFPEMGMEAIYEFLR